MKFRDAISCQYYSYVFCKIPHAHTVYLGKMDNKVNYLAEKKVLEL